MFSCFHNIMSSCTCQTSLLTVLICVVMFSCVPGIEFADCTKIREVSFLRQTDWRTGISSEMMTGELCFARLNQDEAWAG
jgi:hypothetical protein